MSPVSDEPWGMLDEAPLPERYGTDTVHVAARDPETLHVYWELTPAARDRLRPVVGEGRVAVRLVTVGHGQHGTELPGPIQDLEIMADVGATYVAWQAGSADILRVRAVLGLVSGAGSFMPVAESPLCAVPPIGPADPNAPRPRVSVGHSPWRRREQA
jgi:hypothetical protein